MGFHFGSTYPVVSTKFERDKEPTPEDNKHAG